MRYRTRITQMARQRGMNAAEVARRLKLHRSNLSAMDRGRRPVSLRALSRIARLLDCGIGDLVESDLGPMPHAFAHPRLQALLLKKESEIPEGSERGWVHAALLAWQRHYRSARPHR